MDTFFGTADAYSHYLGELGTRRTRSWSTARRSSGLGARARPRTRRRGGAPAPPGRRLRARRRLSPEPQRALRRDDAGAPATRRAGRGTDRDEPPDRAPADVRPRSHLVPPLRRALSVGRLAPSTSASASTHASPTTSAPSRRSETRLRRRAQRPSPPPRQPGDRAGGAGAHRVLRLRPPRAEPVVAAPAALPRRALGARHVPDPRLVPDGPEPPHRGRAPICQQHAALREHRRRLAAPDRREGQPRRPLRARAEVVAYRDADELVAQARRYLDDDEARREVAAAGQARTLRDHTYAVRMRELAAILEAHR